MGSHRILEETPLAAGLSLRHLAHEAHCDLPDVDTNSGYHKYGDQWWTNPDCPYAFQYLSIDSLYPERYFDSQAHPTPGAWTELYSYITTTYFSLFGRPLLSVLELGPGNGGLTLLLEHGGIDYLTVEGTGSGVKHLTRIGIPPIRIYPSDIKFLPHLHRSFDLVVCTEVAEHIEPFFASALVCNCVTHSDAVWFSAAPRGNTPHYHHSNEQPIEAWDNIFAHMGHTYYVPLNGMQMRASRLYLSEETGYDLSSSSLLKESRHS